MSRILIVEDEALVAMELGLLLEDMGHEVAGFATDSRMALENFCNSGIELALVDVHLADGPTGPARIPLFVVSHDTPDDVPEDGVYTFVGDIRSALDAARATAGDTDVGIMGGADIARQYLAEGLVDEISIHLVPVLFGSGTPLFGDGWLEQHVKLEGPVVVDTDAATHLRYRVVK